MYLDIIHYLADFAFRTVVGTDKYGFCRICLCPHHIVKKLDVTLCDPIFLPQNAAGIDYEKFEKDG